MKTNLTEKDVLNALDIIIEFCSIEMERKRDLNDHRHHYTYNDIVDLYMKAESTKGSMEMGNLWVFDNIPVDQLSKIKKEILKSKFVVFGKE